MGERPTNSHDEKEQQSIVMPSHDRALRSPKLERTGQANQDLYRWDADAERVGSTDTFVNPMEEVIVRKRLLLRKLKAELGKQEFTRQRLHRELIVSGIPDYERGESLQFQVALEVVLKHYRARRQSF
jgi:hypothetical protein